MEQSVRKIMPWNTTPQRYPLPLLGALCGLIAGLLGHCETTTRFALFMIGALVGGVLTMLQIRWRRIKSAQQAPPNVRN